jgi:hypothetical protein
MLGAIRERAGLRVLLEGPGLELLLGFRWRMAIGLRVGAWAREMGRRGGPGVGRGEVAVVGLRTSLGRRRREGRGEVVGGREGVGGGGG